MAERTESGLILPGGGGDSGVVVPITAAFEKLQQQEETLQRQVAMLEEALGEAAVEIELLRRRAGDGPTLPLPNRKTRRALERKARKGGRP